MFAKIQERVLALSIEPDTPASIAVTDTHRDQPNVCCAVRRSVERRGNNLTNDTDGDGAERILMAVLADKDDLGAATSAGRHQPQICCCNWTGIYCRSGAKQSRHSHKFCKSSAHSRPQADQSAQESKNLTQGQLDLGTLDLGKFARSNGAA